MHDSQCHDNNVIHKVDTPRVINWLQSFVDLIKLTTLAMVDDQW